MVLFGSDADGSARLDHSMQEVLDETQKLGLTPPWTLSPAEARKQPTPADGAKQVMRNRGIDPDADLGVATKDFTIPGPSGAIQARLYGRKNETGTKPVVVYFHGGGWVIADLDVYDSTPRALALATDCIFVSCHYRQAPEHKFPAAHEDAWAAYKWVIENAASFDGDPTRVAVMGESAGGNLAANVSIRARDEGFPLPVTQILVYPVADNDTNSTSYLENANAVPLNKPFMEWFVSHVFDGQGQTEDPRLKLVSANLAGLPPTMIIAADVDPLRTEGKILAARLEAAGVDTSYTCYEGVTHEFFGMGLVVKDAAAAQTKVAAQLKKELRVGILGRIAGAFS
ncbi:alpha/beta hydrolase [Sphingomonas xinjiangensis]|uniref:Acetyl esterase/lipase n=1 Tax=Sphingomonas xinjiangensis TaxID=643568 RepID=A0A840YHS9_9SPHN|nr:alpha/beta hydrolase [Sphingomonas xinjiangensis]MBB5711579.1 acetyl esterase/lipase [Sphingomonas xinjiangensis]